MVSCMALLVASAMPQGELGKSRGGGQSSGGSSSGGSSTSKSSGGSQSSGGQSSGGALGNLGKSKGGGQSTGGGQSSGGSSSGLGRGTGGGQSSGGGALDRGRGSGGGQTTGGSSSGLGRGTGGGQSSGGGALDRGRGSGGQTTGGGPDRGRGSGGGQSSGGLGDLGKGRGQGSGSSSGGVGSGSQTSGGLGNLGKGRGSEGSQTGGLGRSNDRGNDRGTGQTGGGLGNLGRDRNQGGNGGPDRTTNTGPRGTNNGQIGGLLQRGNGTGSTTRGRLGGGGGYGEGNNNINRGNNDRNNNGGGNTGRFQVPNLNKGSIANQVLRQDHTRVNNGWNDRHSNGWRTGYSQYDNGWRDSYFNYPYYAFTPFNNQCTISPWYYYSNMPAYISVTRIIYVNNYQSCRWGYGEQYNFSGYNSGGFGNNRGYTNNASLDDAIYDIKDVFERGDKRALDRMVPRSGRVAIYNDGQYSYSLGADDFYDLILDNVYGTETTKYDVYQAFRNGNTAQIYARHYFRDAFGNTQTVMHTYGLTMQGRDYVITDFSTGYRTW